MSSSSDDSSDDENAERLREALDGRFIDDSMYSATGRASIKKESKVEPKQLPSKRPVAEESVSHHLKVTPEFQSYVAKKLSKFLDEQIKEVRKDLDQTRSNDEISTGVYLLKSSESYLSCEGSADSLISQQNYRRSKKMDKNKRQEDLSEVVVSPEWVLKQEGTKGWARNTKKSPLFCYKKNKKGSFELISESS